MRDDYEHDLETLARSAWRAYLAATAAAVPQGGWDGLSDDAQNRWVHAARQAQALSETGAELSATDAAARLYYSWYRSVDGSISPVTFDELGAEARVAFEAAARHLARLVADPDEADDLAHMEKQWGPWAKERLAAPSKKGAV